MNCCKKKQFKITKKKNIIDKKIITDSSEIFHGEKRLKLFNVDKLNRKSLISWQKYIDFKEKLYFFSKKILNYFLFFRKKQKNS